MSQLYWHRGKAPVDDQVFSKSERDLALANDEQIPLIDNYIEDVAIEQFPDVAIFGARKLAEWLFEKGRIDEERYNEFKRISAGKNKNAGSNSFKDVLESKYRILVENHTIELMEEYGLVDSLLNLGVQLFVEEHSARAIKQSVREIDFQGEVGNWQKDLIDSLKRYTFFEEASYQSKRKDAHELLLDVIISPIEFANERNIFLLTDDRFCQQVALQENFYNRFGSDALLKEFYDKKIIDIDKYARAFLQLCNWRYRFLLPDVDVLLFFAQKYRNNLPGQSLKTIVSYCARCMEDLGLFLGFENSEPPMPLGVKYYMELSGIWIEFLVAFWKEGSVAEDNLYKFTRWVLLEAYPVPPKSLNSEIRRGLLRSQKQAIVLRLFTYLGIGIKDSFKYHKLLVTAFELSHFKDEERVQALLDFLAFSDKDKYEDEVKKIIVIKALELFYGVSVDHIEIDNPMISMKLNELGFALKSSRDLSPEEEKQILQDIDSSMETRTRTSEYNGPLIPRVKREKELTITSAHDLISAPSSIVRKRTIDFLLNADFLLNSTKELLKNNTTKILDNDPLIWNAVALELKDALLHDFKYSCQFFCHALRLGNRELSAIAWKAVLNPEIEFMLEEMPWCLQQNNVDSDYMVRSIKKQFVGLSTIEDILNKVYAYSAQADHLFRSFRPPVGA